MLKRASTLVLRRGLSILNNDRVFRVHPSVSQALAENRPVVALESTIITHGMPYPHNLRTALEVEAIVRAEKATPATVGVIRGKVHVGLSSGELDFLARCDGSMKVSRRDLPYVVSQGLSGGTTVSATMIAAHRAGIPVFVTGGIGGVHRDGHNSLDISADLTELSRTPIAVVSAGVKSILDIGRTLEYLETQGVCVATYGPSKEFPAFFSPSSGFTSPCQVCDPDKAAELIESALSLGVQSGVLIAVPIPEEHAAAGRQMEGAIQAALEEANAKGIRGRDVTPYILQRVNELTKGKSLHANIAVIHNNAKVGSHISFALAARTKKSESQSQPSDSNIVKSESQSQPPDSNNVKSESQSQPSDSNIVVIGGINVDFIAKGKIRTDQPRKCVSVIWRRGKKHQRRHRLFGFHVFFLRKNTSGVSRLEGASTATYCAVITEAGEVSLGLGDMDIHQHITQQYVSQFKEQLLSSTLVCLDGNIPISTIRYVCSLAKEHNINVWYEPTDSEKASKPFLSDAWKSLAYTSPNLAELCTMNKTLGLQTPEVLPSSLEQLVSLAVALSRPLLEHIHCLVVTLGAHGVLVCGEHHAGSVRLQPRTDKKERKLCAVHYPALKVAARETINVSGAGDSLAGALMAGMVQGQDTDTCVRMGLLAARLSLASPHPIAHVLTAHSVDPHRVPHHSWPPPRFLWID
ncbi:uncharacterized protein zgc:136858 isoform X3 [Nerophis ophidion]|uniref:uncharacterized protein zgc:136858 isoform X3 n=1 Tax=Nerophis ophidion TaxID=159077 RepID=UPI002ADF7893|nr:uncharacterized protein zgc:136858 isoform X3 [Nerophis ophidion]